MGDRPILQDSMLVALKAADSIMATTTSDSLFDAGKSLVRDAIREAEGETLLDRTRNLARAFKKEADKLDTAFVENGDSRAIQGGAICEEAGEMRKTADQLYRICNQIEDFF